MLFVRALVALLLLPGVVAFLVPLLLLPRGGPIATDGLVVLALGCVVLLWCARDFYVSGRGTLAPWSPPTRLVTVGLYRRSRNPMYIGVLLIVAGWALAYRSRAIALYGVGLAVAFHLRVRLAEEPWLARTFDAEWARYAASVPRWVLRVHHAPGRSVRTTRLRLVPNTLADIRAHIAAMTVEERAQVSPQWLAQLDAAGVDTWTLGYVIRHRQSGALVGACGFKGPPDANGMVEIAYGIAPECRQQGYATEAAQALVDISLHTPAVQVVRAHTLSDTNASSHILRKLRFHCLGTVDDPHDGIVWRWERRRGE